MRQREISGFTLIELLVVIAVIALLLAVLVPALSSAKKFATSAACLSNQKSISRAWYMYQEQNDAFIPGGAITEQTMTDGLTNNNIFHPIWVFPPVDQQMNYLGSLNDHPTLVDRQRGCENGSLGGLLESHKVYHCPADRDFAKNDSPYDRYRSYSIPRGLAVYNPDNDIRKFTELKSPGYKYCFVEEAYDYLGNYNYNHNSWDFEPWQNDFHDPLALFHNDSSTFGFADGHAEKYKWRDERTVEYFADRAGYPFGAGSPELCDNNQDLVWLQNHFAYKKENYN